jgi:acetyltransferase-like isoleucine patch superfamily enzyme
MSVKLATIRVLRAVLAYAPQGGATLGKFRRRLELGELYNTDMCAYRFERAKDMGVSIGRNCRLLSLNIFSEPTLVDIGENTIVSGNVVMLTHDGAICSAAFNEIPDINGFYGRISIGKNCFIGFGSIILPNVHIGDNCIVGAGSVVADSFPDDCVISGNPAKLLLPRSMYVRMKQHSPNTIVDPDYRFPLEMPVELLMARVGHLPVRPPRPTLSPDRQTRSESVAPNGRAVG